MSGVTELCDWKKDMIAARFAELRTIVSEPRFVCRKCARVANHEKWLCKPQDLDAGRSNARPRPAQGPAAR